MVINSQCFPDFTKRDLRFFKLIDGTATDPQDLANLEYFEGKQKTNLKKDALFIALSVLAKSAAALIISRHQQNIPKNWEILAIPYSGANNVDFDELFGDTKPFETSVKTWIKETEAGDWYVAYKAGSVLVYFLFVFYPGSPFLKHMADLYADDEPRVFRGSKLLELVDYEWEKI